MLNVDVFHSVNIYILFCVGNWVWICPDDKIFVSEGPVSPQPAENKLPDRFWFETVPETELPCSDILGLYYHPKTDEVPETEDDYVPETDDEVVYDTDYYYTLKHWFLIL